MAETSDKSSVVIWSDAHRAELVRAVLARVEDVTVSALGGPRRAQLGDLADSLGVRANDDLRRLIVDEGADYLLLASAAGIGAEELTLAVQRGMTILAVDPPAIAIEPGAGPNRLVIAPWLRLSPAWLAAADPQQALGKIESINLTAVGPTESGSLYGRLYDGLDTIGHLLGMPDAIIAHLTGPLGEVPEDPRGLTGHITASVRISDEACASLLVSDRAATWSRRLTVLGRSGQFIADDVSYRLWSADGAEVDTLTGPDAPPDVAELIAHQWQWMLQHAALPEVSSAEVVACCAAAVLSCRTGEPESPAEMLRLHQGT